MLGLGTRQSQVVPFSLGLTPATVIMYRYLLLCWLGGQAISSPHRPTMLLVTFMATVCSTAALMLRNASNAEASASVLVLVRESWLIGLVLFILVVVRSTGGLRLVMRGIVIGTSISGAVGLLNTLIGLDLSSALALPGMVDQGSLLVSALATVSRSAVIGAAAALAVMAWSWPVRRVIVLVASGGCCARPGDWRPVRHASRGRAVRWLPGQLGRLEAEWVSSWAVSSWAVSDWTL